MALPSRGAELTSRTRAAVGTAGDDVLGVSAGGAGQGVELTRWAVLSERAALLLAAGHAVVLLWTSFARRLAWQGLGPAGGTLTVNGGTLRTIGVGRALQFLRVVVVPFVAVIAGIALPGW